ncbi:hypothetical protein GCK72_025478 [Caenorhabditis remanei]|uniref:F-box associated domain-containing protein n=1 Tax=Caenorhabditis remanei TaxID=31234 RepID=A0A6A5G2Q0_CAERE|nr:hypothetical protein GCK72_025478 [Caenorhabditis remanei]KAF1749011.1 hypothetical protein GCK72_025478 [Caenorhabditis remanei]
MRRNTVAPSSDLRLADVAKFIPSDVVTKKSKFDNVPIAERSAKRKPKQYSISLCKDISEVKLEFENTSNYHSWKIMENSLLNSWSSSSFSSGTPSTTNTESLFGILSPKNIMLHTVKFVEALRVICPGSIHTVTIDSGLFNTNDAFFQTTENIDILRGCKILHIGDLTDKNDEKIKKCKNRPKCDWFLRNFIVAEELIVHDIYYNRNLNAHEIENLDKIDITRKTMRPNEILKCQASEARIGLREFSHDNMNELIVAWLRTSSTSLHRLSLWIENLDEWNVKSLFKGLVHYSSDEKCCILTEGTKNDYCKACTMQTFETVGIDFRRHDGACATLFFSTGTYYTFALVFIYPGESTDEHWWKYSPIIEKEEAMKNEFYKNHRESGPEVPAHEESYTSSLFSYARRSFNKMRTIERLQASLKNWEFYSLRRTYYNVTRIESKWHEGIRERKKYGYLAFQ